jgi:lactate racemase
LKPMSVGNVYLYSDRLPRADLDQRTVTGVNRITSIEESIRERVTENPAISVAVIPEGPYVVPFYRPH